MNINVSTIVNLRQILLIGDRGKSKHERKKEKHFKLKDINILIS